MGEDARNVDLLRARCTRFLNGHGVRWPAEVLAELPPDIEIDRYGEGGVVAELERAVADLLGKPAAVFMPSGTMAQQIALRLHADRTNRRTVAFHPTSHLELHERQAYQRLHGLIGRTVGDPRALITLGDLEAIPEPLAALLLELPQRELGGVLPAWEDLCAQVAWARDHGAAAHLDGARLWDVGPFYGRPYAEIAGLFDSVYVSFYKLLGALGGACLAGDVGVVAEAREWRHRHGGTLVALWPAAASALAGLRLRLPRVPAYVAHAQAVAAALGEVPGVEVIPEVPPTPMMHLRLRVDAERFTASAHAIAEREGLWTFPRGSPTDSPGWQRVELMVGDATLQLTAAEVAEVVRRLIA
jgi:threonine aldolase